MRNRPAMLFIILLVIFVVPYQTPEVEAHSSCSEINALFLVGTGFGWSYFGAKSYLESWGVNVTTVSRFVSTEVQSCPNKELRPITADVLLSDFDMDHIAEYDCIYIPSGPHWQGLADSQRVKDFITAAHEARLVIATQCTGNVALARMDNLTTDTMVTDYLFANMDLLHPEAIQVDSTVVIDNRLVTGESGGGYAGIGGIGVESVPIYEVCTALVRAVIGSSFVQSAIIEPLGGENAGSYTISVETTNPYVVLPEVNTTEISVVNAVAYRRSNFSNHVASIQLSDDDHDGIYTGVIAEMQEDYIIAIEVEDDIGIFEVVRDTVRIAEFPLLTASMVVIGGFLVAIVGIVLWKKKIK
ncbi:MAG: DJ-1/PfpI family protein [Candidatus Thorarchaeota archaeon]|nr:DJ-1/PfpI family protein [Candidatus Thorarchaeota archaeon]